MDPNSRRSQFSPFNTRDRRTGPMASSSRHSEVPSKPVLLFDSKAQRRMPGSRRPSVASVTSIPSPRRIASNSRVRQEEYTRQSMHLAFVNDALQQMAQGNAHTYDQLVDEFNVTKNPADTPSSTSHLRTLLLALTHVVSRLERQHASLVQAIIALPWTTMDTAFVKAYTQFIGVLVSARPEYLSLILDKLVLGFTHQSGLQALDAGEPESSARPLTRGVVYDRLHYMLRHILGLIPTLASVLQPMLIQNFPHKRQSQVAQATYIRNLLRINEYCPELSERILSTIIDRAIQIDVEIQVELEELEELEAQRESTEGLFDLDPFDTVVGQEEKESDDEEEDYVEDTFSDLSSDAGGGIDDDDGRSPESIGSFDAIHVQDMARKLDAILKLLFDHFAHYQRTIFSSSTSTNSLSLSRPDSPSSLSSSTDSPLRPSSPDTRERGCAQRRQQFHVLLAIFERTILRTFKSRYTQFLLFWYASLDAEFADLFQGMLLSRALLEPAAPPVARAAATSYIGSLVSRARFVDGAAARAVVGVLCAYLRTQLDAADAHGPTEIPGDVHNGVFYAVAQAVFLVFCFRWRDLVDEDNEGDDELAHNRPPGAAKRWMSELKVLQRVVTSPLNPFKVCSANVVSQFARVAHATGFLYCYSIIEANKRDGRGSPLSTATAVRRNAGTSKGEALHADLNTFFPFDPYNLPRSSAYVQGVYREWSSVAIEEEEEEEEYDNPEEDDADDQSGQPEELSPSKKDDATEGLGESFGGMSISPLRAVVVS